MRILIFHGYLLDGTGSNVYNARLAAALARLGHEVHLCCQDRRAESYPFVDAVGDWDHGELTVTALRDPVRCTAYRPPIGRLLPVYVADRYEGFDARTFLQCSDAEIDDYVSRNVAAVRELAERVAPDVALANHLVMGPLILARALQGLDLPYAVKVHGSALEYTVKADPQRFLPAAVEGLARCRGVLVGSAHTALSLWRALRADDDLVARTRLGPPGVDIEGFAPRPHAAAAAGVRTLAKRLAARAEEAEATEAAEAGARGAGAGVADAGGADGAEDGFARDEGAAAAALRRLDPDRDRMIGFVGKLIVSKGADLLIAAAPLVIAVEPRARFVIVGFGAYRDGLERLVAALGAGDLGTVGDIARRGRELEGGPPEPLGYLQAFIDGLHGAGRERYLAAAARLPERVALTGRLGHEELADLLPAFEALVVPSTFPEAFGMVAAEAAACGALPISANHSGLAEVSHALAAAVPPEVAPWLSFPLGPDAVQELADRLVSWLTASDPARVETRAALAAAARRRYSWEGVAEGVLAAARGQLDGLVSPLRARRRLG